MFDMPVDIENEKIRDGINTELDNATESSSLTPYIALEKVRKILMPYHIHVPRYLFKDDEHGILTFEARQFGDIYGMKDDGQVYTKDEYPYLLYFEYQKNEIGMYDVFCEIIDRADLAEIQNDLEEEGDDLMEGKVIPFPTKKPKTDDIPRGFLPPDDDAFDFKGDVELEKLTQNRHYDYWKTDKLVRHNNYPLLDTSRAYEHYSDHANERKISPVSFDVFTKKLSDDRYLRGGKIQANLKL